MGFVFDLKVICFLLLKFFLNNLFLTIKKGITFYFSYIFNLHFRQKDIWAIFRTWKLFYKHLLKRIFLDSILYQKREKLFEFQAYDTKYLTGNNINIR